MISIDYNCFHVLIEYFKTMDTNANNDITTKDLVITRKYFVITRKLSCNYEKIRHFDKRYRNYEKIITYLREKISLLRDNYVVITSKDFVNRFHIFSYTYYITVNVQ